jgi:2-amino-4-hydroxy-6-hydroxymethyldihydropteridine diphosphokinase
MPVSRVYIGLGSNLENPVDQVNSALDSLRKLEHSKLTSVSSLYISKPMGPADQPDFINAVACLETSLEPNVLLDALQGIEQAHGRQRGDMRWGPRTLDLDILLYGDKSIKSERLSVPHPGLHERSFVLYPLQEINPDLQIPGYGHIAELITHCSSDRLERLSKHDS